MASIDSLPHQTDTDTKSRDNDVMDPRSDVEKQSNPAPNGSCEPPQPGHSVFKSLDLLDRFLAVWIFLAMLIGILLGNFVGDVGPALQRGTFVDVSVPIGMCFPCLSKSNQV
jgi:ACR3 family arsenite transporter